VDRRRYAPAMTTWPTGAAARLLACGLLGVGGACACGASGRKATRPSVARPPGAAGILGEAAQATRRYPPGRRAEQTHPGVTPPRGRSTTTFTVRVTAGRTLGVSGAGRYSYRILVAGPRPRCTEFTDVTAARRGSRIGVRLVAPLVTGWCQGRLHGVVVLDEDPYCPPPAPTGPVRPCRLFATRSLDVGRFSFLVAG
jgi:hypothetical protein